MRRCLPQCLRPQGSAIVDQTVRRIDILQPKTATADMRSSTGFYQATIGPKLNYPVAMNDQTICRTCPVKERSLCGALGPEDLSALHHSGRRHRLRRGDTLYWAGEDSSLVANLLSGVLKVVATSVDGDTQTVGLHHPADFVGSLYGATSDYTVTAVTDVDVCIFPRSAFERLLENSRDLERQLLRRTLIALNEARTRILALMHRSADAKVAGLLIELAERASDAVQATPSGPRTFDLPLSRGEIAELLGLTIETVSRQMSQLRSEGIVALPGGRTVTIRDQVALRRRAAA